MSEWVGEWMSEWGFYAVSASEVIFTVRTTVQLFQSSFVSSRVRTHFFKTISKSFSRTFNATNTVVQGLQNAKSSFETPKYIVVPS